MPAVYAFEAKSIQSYILDGNKLKDMVAASEQIEYLCFDGEEKCLLDEVTEALSIKPEYIRKAGGAFTAILASEAEAKNLQAAWTLAVQRFLPGVSYAQGLKSYAEGDLRKALKALRKQLAASRNLNFAMLPEAGPYVARSPRTGQPAYDERDRREDATELMDAGISRKHMFFGVLKRDKKNRLRNKLISTKIHDEADISHFEWPDNMDDDDKDGGTPFPFKGDNRYVGIIHADGNGLGQLIRDLDGKTGNLDEAKYCEVFRAFSNAIEKATVKAAKSAISVLIEEKKLQKSDVMPARPLVLGGDDLTFIVRGDLAVPFTKRFLERFEEYSAAEFNQPILKQFQLKALTACAGIAFVKATQPFYQAYRLAESLCAHAKEKSARKTSCLAFHRITTSVIEEYGAILSGELSVGSGDDKRIVSMNPYSIGKTDSDLPLIDELLGFCVFLESEKVSKGAVRELFTLLHLSSSEAERAFARWQENMQRSTRENLADLKDKLSRLTGSHATDLNALFDAKQRTPIGDALALNMVGRGEG
jgi:hypothetical protein